MCDDWLEACEAALVLYIQVATATRTKKSTSIKGEQWHGSLAFKIAIVVFDFDKALCWGWSLRLGRAVQSMKSKTFVIGTQNRTRIQIHWCTLFADQQSLLVKTVGLSDDIRFFQRLDILLRAKSQEWCILSLNHISGCKIGIEVM